MGGDAGPRLTVPAALSTLNRHPGIRIRLFGDTSVLGDLVSGCGAGEDERLELIHCSQVVAMEEKPVSALRNKRQSSLWRGLEATARQEANAFVSAGNTGAIMAMGMELLGKLNGISRPAICTSLPTASGRAYLLDMGANVDCSAEHLLQFARMATHLVTAVEGKSRPRVGLLNIGLETTKGTAVVRQASALCSGNEEINYGGFVEGDGIFSGDFDIVVCDGFAGNVALKASEGAARMVAGMVRASLGSSLRGRLTALLARPVLRSLQQRIDPALYNGASLLGLDGVVIKSHGGTTQAGFEHALDVAITESRQDIPRLIGQKLQPAVSD